MLKGSSGLILAANRKKWMWPSTRLSTKKTTKRSKIRAKRAIENAASDATLQEMDGKHVVTNDGGQSLLDSMQAILNEQRALRAEYGREVSELKTRMGRMEKLGSFFIDVRERAFLTYLRDKWRQPNLTTRVRSLNRSIVHGGCAEADALMFSERRPAEDSRQFVYLYGFEPEMILDLANRGLKSVLKALNAVEGFHLEGKYLIKDEETIYEEIKKLVNDGKFDEAEKISKKFPFEKGFIDFDPLIETE